MAETWELICHHTYTGIPGVVVDLSPTAASYGRALGIDDGNFLTDGATTGSGLVRFDGDGSVVYVPADAPAWQSVVGAKAEVILRLRGPTLRMDIANYTVFDSDSFSFEIRGVSLVARFNASPPQYLEVDSFFGPFGAERYVVPEGQWITLGFMHDGFGTIELYANGKVVARRSGALAPLNPPGAAGLYIGNVRKLNRSLNGDIDDVKIWRLNPRRFDDNFFNRPVDGDTAECWKCFWQELSATARRNPECAEYVISALYGMIQKLVREAFAKGPETKAHLLKLAHRYDELWRKNDIGGAAMAKVFADLLAWLKLIGLSPESDPELMALNNSDCMKELLAGIKPPDCDAKMMSMLRSIVHSLNASREHHPQS